MASGFVDFFAREGAGHFRDEEEHLFPLLADCGDSATSLLAEIAVQHAAVRSLVGHFGVRSGLGASRRKFSSARSCSNNAFASERQLFPLIEEIVTDEDAEAFHSPREPWSRQRGQPGRQPDRRTGERPTVGHRK